MAFHNSFTGDGATDLFTTTFPFLDQDHIVVEVDDVATSFTWDTATTVKITPAPAVSAAVVVRRSTPVAPIVTFTNGTRVNADLLNTAILQPLYLAEEAPGVP